MPNWKTRLAHTLFGAQIAQEVANAVKVLDDRWWTPLDGTPANRDLELTWSELREQMVDCANAYRTNPLVHRIVQLASVYTIGSGYTLRSDNARVQAFLQEWSEHPRNRLAQRLARWSDSLALYGELYIVYNIHPVHGFAYLRELPPVLVDQVETDPEDWETDLRYHQLTADAAGRWWIAATNPAARPEGQLVSRFTVNRPIGCVRGFPEVLPILPWCQRYAEWLQDRARLNKYRTAFLWHCSIANPAPGELERKRAQYLRQPAPGSILITDANERWEAVNPNIAAESAYEDGRALRMSVAAGAGVPLHFLADGESATRATAREMNQPTYRTYQRRQAFLKGIVAEVVTTAWQIKTRSQERPLITIETEDLSREDNLALAQAARQIVEALSQMKQQGWIDDVHAASIALRFAGELLPAAEIEGMLS